jgi:maleate isomerase
VQTVTTPEQGFHAIYLTSTQAATQAAQRLTQSTADAVLMLGTGMPTLKTLLAQRGQAGPPMLSSMLALMWQSVSRVNALSVEPHRSIHPIQEWLHASHWAARAHTMGIEP